MRVSLVWRCQGQNGPNLAEFPSFSNFSRAIASLGIEHDPQKVLQLTALEKLDSFVSYEFSLFNSLENRKSQSTQDIRVPSVGALSKNHVLPLARLWHAQSSTKMAVGLVWRCQGKNGRNLAEFPSFSKFARVVASQGLEHDPEKVFQLTALKKLDSFVSYEFSLFNTWESRHSQTTRDFRVPSIGALSKNHVLPLVRF